MARMAGALGMDLETFTSRYQEQRGPYDRGDLDPLDYWSRVAPAHAALDHLLVDTLRQWDVEMWCDINHDMVAWLIAVRAAGFKTALLSNMHPDMALYARRCFDWLRHLDAQILSCELHLVKPEPAIYLRCLEQLALQPCQALFIDDREANVRAATHAGLIALRFETIESLRSQLAALGFPVLPKA